MAAFPVDSNRVLLANPHAGRWKDGGVMTELTRDDIYTAITVPRRCYVSSFGCAPGAGFGAAYLGLISSLATCIDLGVGFRLVKITRPQGFVTNSGYTDYFKPFCGEVSGLLLQFLNRSPLPYSGKLPFIKDLAAAWLRVATRPQADYFAFEKIKSAEVVAAPLFDVGMSWALKRRSLMRALWEYNDQTSEEVDAIKARITLPPQYLSMCIRRGDKSIEFQYVALERYQEAVASVDLGYEQFS